MQKQHIAFIVKEHQRKKQVLDKWVDSLKSEYRVSVFLTQYAGHAIELARKCIIEGVHKLVAVGGDGTLHEVVNGVMASGYRIPLLYLPNGTANDWGKTFAPPADGVALVRRLNQAPQMIDVGCINFISKKGRRYFINIADCGMGADVVQRVNGSSLALPADLKFATAILRTFVSYRNQSCQIEIDGQVIHDGKVRAVVCANGKYFGSGLCIGPDANPTDGEFQVIIIGDVSLWDYLRYVPVLKKGEHIRHPEVHYHSAHTVRVVSENMGAEADGEFLGNGTVEFSILSKSLALL